MIGAKDYTNVHSERTGVRCAWLHEPSYLRRWQAWKPDDCGLRIWPAAS